MHCCVIILNMLLHVIAPICSKAYDGGVLITTLRIICVLIIHVQPSPPHVSAYNIVCCVGYLLYYVVLNLSLPLVVARICCDCVVLITTC